jgi:TolB-like protein/Tfp pilus assembly protein PilF
MGQAETNASPQIPPPEPPVSGGVSEQPADPSTHSTDSFWDRIKRHKVVEWTLAYVAFAYAVLHGVQMAREAFEWPAAVSRITLLVLLLGTPIAATLAWYHGHRARHRISGVELSILIALLLVAGSVLWWASRMETIHVASTAVADATHFNPSLGDKSIAVLPFVDLSEKKDQEYFADGMAEEIVDLLAKIPGLTVIGRTSSFQFKGKNEDLRTIGAKLNAAHVLEGSVRKSRDQVRITAQLIRTQTGAHEWSETYDRHIGDVLKLQDAIAAAVVRELQLTVSPGYLSSRSTIRDAEAYDLLLRGRRAADRWNEEGFDEAVTLLKQALDRDPASADAAAELAHAYQMLGDFGSLAPSAAFEQARRAAMAALRLDSNNARAHFVLGNIHILYDWDWASAEQDFRQAAALAPGSADGIQGQARLSLVLGRWDDALRQVDAALAQDPLDLSKLELLSIIQTRRRRLTEAEAVIRRVLDVRPNYSWAHFELGVLLLVQGDRDGALVEMQRETAEIVKQPGLAMAYFSLGRRAESDAILARMIKERAETNAFQIAEVYALRGRSDEAMHWLERAYGQKDASMWLVKGDPPLANLEANPRHQALLRKMNLPE